MLFGQPSRTPLFFVYLRSGWPGSCKSTRTSRFCGIRRPCWEQAVADARRWFRYGWCCRCMQRAARPLCGGGGDRAGFAGGRTVPAPLSGFACTRHGKHFLRIVSELSTRCTQSLHRAFLTGLAGVGFSAGIGGGQVATEALSRGVDTRWASFRPVRHGALVVVHHEASGILPVLVEVQAIQHIWRFQQAGERRRKRLKAGRKRSVRSGCHARPLAKPLKRNAKQVGSRGPIYLPEAGDLPLDPSRILSPSWSARSRSGTGRTPPS